MNPFDLRGPEFLLFYGMLVVTVLIIVNRRRRHFELAEHGDLDANQLRLTPHHKRPGDPHSGLTDPYLVAFLRGGKNEVIRTAVVALVDRGLLELAYDKIVTSTVGTMADVRKNIEAALLEHFGGDGRQPSTLFSDSMFNNSRLDRACAEYENRLRQNRLLPDAAIMAARWRLFFLGAGVLLCFAGTKIVVAIANQRHNIGFLIIFALIALILTGMSAFPRVTASGKAFLAEMRNLFRALQLRARRIPPGGETSEVAIIVAVFGVAALQGDNFAWAQRLFPKAQSSSACGAACGSSSGGSSGSSCGGGCGGGCGGCGG